MMMTEHCCAWNPRRNTSHETTAFEITGCRARRLRHRSHSFVNAADPAGCSSAALVQGGLAATETRGPRNRRKHALHAGGNRLLRNEFVLFLWPFLAGYESDDA